MSAVRSAHEQRMPRPKRRSAGVSQGEIVAAANISRYACRLSSLGARLAESPPGAPPSVGRPARPALVMDVCLGPFGVS